MAAGLLCDNALIQIEPFSLKRALMGIISQALRQALGRGKVGAVCY